jgi:putative transposase
MRNVIRIAKKSNREKLKHARIKDVLNDRFESADSTPIDSQFMLISALLPPAVKAFIEQCEAEVTQLCGARYRHGKENQRWGAQNGSVVIANQRVAIEKPRVRNKLGQEVNLQTYEDFQNPELFDQSVFVDGVRRVSQRDYEKGVRKIANSFGFKKSSVSRKWIKTTAKKIEELQNRSIKEMDIRIVFIDGKRFAKLGVIIALGVGSGGHKHVLGIYQAASEDHGSCLNMLNDLEKRGMPAEGLIFVVDGGSGINKALDLKYFCDDKTKRKAIRIRCFVHKWRNLESSLGDDADQVVGLFWALRDAKDLNEAKNISDKLETVLKNLNLSSLHSYLEAKEDLLVIHELKLSNQLKRFVSTTNPIESLNSLIEEDMRRVKKWKDSTHFQRWLATYCLEAEKKMRRIRGHNALPALWIKLRTLTENKVNEEIIDNNQAIA